MTASLWPSTAPVLCVAEERNGQNQLEFLHRFLGYPAQDAQERPRKRQRMSGAVVPIFLPGGAKGDFDVKDFVVDQISLDVVSSHQQTTSTTADLPVVISSSSTSRNDTFMVSKIDASGFISDDGTLGLVITKCTPGPQVFELRVRTDFAQNIQSRLRAAIQYSYKASVGRKDSAARAYFKVSFLSDRFDHVKLQAYCLWRKDIAAALMSSSEISTSTVLLAQYNEDHYGTWGIPDFYSAIHTPSKAQWIATELDDIPLACELYPFQKRAVSWMLRREGVCFESGRLKSLSQSEKDVPPSCYSIIKDSFGNSSYYSQLHGMITDHPPQYPSLAGGILCEEMGLGKTVEILALISLHKRKCISAGRNDQGLYESGATLIITPPHLMQQWQSEIARHAPMLRIVVYTGMQPMKKKRTEEQHIMDLQGYDIVLTTYTVLARDIYYAEKPPDRKLRHAKEHGAPRSPLVQISWWRICLDEAQMIDTGVTKAAIVARLIPRMNAWAVSGTPLKKDREDLFGLLLFLGYEPFCDSRKLWSRVDIAKMTQIVSQIAVRHTKDSIREELGLPRQTRFVMTMPFTAIEDQNYTQLFQQMCRDCGLNSDGSPATDHVNFNFEDSKLIGQMRDWLQRLRQTCLHPQVGSRNRRRLGRGNRPLRTIFEVLDVMIDQNYTGLRAEQRQLIYLKVRHGLIISNNQADPIRWATALDTYQTALESASKTVDEVKEDLALEIERKAPVVEGHKATDLLNNESSDSDGDGSAGENSRVAVLQKILRSAHEVQHVCAFWIGTAYYQLKEAEGLRVDGLQDPAQPICNGEDESSSSTEQPKNDRPRSDEHTRLESLEARYYEQAKAIRKELLKEWSDAALRSMQRIASLPNLKQVKSVLFLENRGGIESRKYLAKLDDLNKLLDRQSEFLDRVWTKAREGLLLPLLDEDDREELNGEEYEASTKTQDELPVYISILRILVGDRMTMITGSHSDSVRREVKMAKEMAKGGGGHYGPEANKGHAPELMLALLAKRDMLVLHETREMFGMGHKIKVQANINPHSLRAVISEMRSTASTLQVYSGESGSRTASEASIIEKQTREAQRFSTAQLKLVEELENNIDSFTKTMNRRNEFYKQLQVISDSVQPFKEELDDELDVVALKTQQAEQKMSEQRLAKFITERRFLHHLRQEESSSEQVKNCVICQCDFENGVLTVCGHAACKECIQLWWRQHRTCPVCRRHLHLDDFHDITYKPQILQAAEERPEPASPTQLQANSGSSSDTTSASRAIYKEMNVSTLRDIRSIDLRGSFGTKIDTMARHLLWIRDRDPGAKSLIYSQYAEFLQVLGGALDHFKIRKASCRDKLGVQRFKEEPGIECFLLDAKTDSSGLNLINATYIFLCEPLINTAVEMQAIARVHRIGQTRPTTVFMYLVSDSVEESIYDISVSRRLAHMTAQDKRSKAGLGSGAQTPQAQEIALDQANSTELQAASISSLLTKGKSGGEVVNNHDLWNCLFSKKNGQGAGASAELAREVDRFQRAEAAGRRQQENLANTAVG